MISLEQLQAGLVIPVDKPRQWTSFQAVNKIKAVIRNTYGIKKIKIGHAGTLDPLATGLLLVCIGKATKTIPQLQDGDKVYTGTMVFGATTGCYDLERPIDKYYPYEHITQQLVSEKAQSFTGTILQVPPMFSAVKIDGQRAYRYARSEVGGMRPEAGDCVNALMRDCVSEDNTLTQSHNNAISPLPIQPKPVTVYSFEITAFRQGDCVNALMRDCVSEDNTLTQSHNNAISPPPTHLYQRPLGEVPPQLPQADFRICCGKGTYIRSLARDLGHALGSGAFLSALRRERIGNYTVDQALSLEGVEGYLKGF